MAIIIRRMLTLPNIPAIHYMLHSYVMMHNKSCHRLSLKYKLKYQNLCFHLYSIVTVCVGKSKGTPQGSKYDVALPSGQHLDSLEHFCPFEGLYNILEAPSFIVITYIRLISSIVHVEVIFHLKYFIVPFTTLVLF